MLFYRLQTTFALLVRSHYFVERDCRKDGARMMKRSSNGQAASDRQTGSGDGLIDLMRRFHTPE
jgi:hypothetical protein